MTTPNAELAYRVLDAIDADPNAWNQKIWMGRGDGCGTSACFAGWACILSGDAPRYEFDDEETTDWVYSGGDVEYIPRRASELLKVPNAYMRDELFDSDNTRQRLGGLVQEIFGPRPGGAA